MKQICNLLCAAVLAASCLTSARADVTIWVKATDAPHVYAWDSEGNKLLGEFPGTELTAQDDVAGWWLCVLPDVSSASIAINNGGQDNDGNFGNQTRDITGLEGTNYFVYNGSNFHLDVTAARDAAAYAYLQPTDYWLNDNAAFAVDGARLTVCGGYNKGKDVYLWTSDAEKSGDITFQRKSTDLSSDWNAFTVAYNKGGFYENNGWNSGAETNTSYRGLAFPTGVVVNDENFPDAAMRAMLRTDTHYIDNCKLNGAGSDNLFTASELAQIPDIEFKSISTLQSVEGIKLFTSLDRLFCTSCHLLPSVDLSNHPTLRQARFNSNNTLAAIDVSGCAKLTRLECRSDKALTDVNTTDCTALELLHCYSSAKLSTLDLSTNTDLMELHCYRCKFATLDVSANTKLRNFSCEDNGLTEILLPPSPNGISWFLADNNKLTPAGLDMTRLENVVVWDLSNNPMGSVDLDNKPMLQDLSVGRCGLSELDLSGCPNLRQLTCPSNSLTALDLSPLTKLEGLSCGNNSIAELDLSQTTSMVGINCANNCLVGLDVAGQKLTWNGRVYTSVYKPSGALEASTHSRTSYNGGAMDGGTNVNTGLWYPDQVRTIEAETGSTVTDDGKRLKYYYFRLNDDEVRESEISLENRLADGNPSKTKTFLVSDVNSWESGIDGIVTGTRHAASADDLKTDLVYGTIMVVTPESETETEASGTFTYKYNVRADALDGATDMQSEFTIHWTANPKVVTGVTAPGVDDAQGEVWFYNPTGQASRTPWTGVNVVVKRLANGTTRTDKAVY